MATLINGDGNPAVYAVQDADWYISLLGGQTRILNRGLKFAYHVEDINTFLMDDGLILTKEGRRIQLDANAQDEVTIPNGVQGETQYYIVGYHLYTDSSANQLCETFIQQMEDATETINEDTFIEGATEVYVSLYRITQTELVVTDVDLLLPVDTTQAEDRTNNATAHTGLSNRITANANDITNIRDLISEVEESDTATKAHASGDFIQYTDSTGTHFAKVVVPIAIGDTIEDDVNVVNTTIAENIKGIERTPITPPTVTGAFVYDGSEKTVSIGTYDATKITIGGVLSATAAGIYEVTMSLIDSYNYVWNDGTNGTKTFTWRIGYENKLAISTNSVSGFLGYGTSTTATVSTITSKSTGEITASTTVGTVAISGNNINLTLPAQTTEYSGKITISDAGDDECYPSTATITITNAYFVKNVTWANGTDAEIAAVVRELDAGNITSAQTGWSVGDSRSVNLAAMPATYVGESHAAETVTFTIYDKEIYNLTTATSGGKTKCSFVVGLKNCLTTKGRMNSTDTNDGSWKSTQRRQWCNEIFKAAVPSDFRTLFKQFQVITAETYNGTTTEITNDYFSLFAEKEIFGAATCGNTTEAGALTQLSYFKTTANRIKKLGDNGSAYYYYERSPRKTNTIGFCCVTDAGSASPGDATTPRGIIVFGCI